MPIALRNASRKVGNENIVSIGSFTRKKGMHSHASLPSAFRLEIYRLVYKGSGLYPSSEL